MAEQEGKASHDVSLIMDDMQSYFERRRFMRFKTVLDEMRKQDVVGSLRQLGDDLKKENGVSIAQCEFWSDTLDRWAEDLVDPAVQRHVPGQVARAACRRRSCWKSLQILEGGGQPPRRDPRGRAGQARAQGRGAQAAGAQALRHAEGPRATASTRSRQQIRELPDGETEFANEIALLGQVAEVMGEATEILARPETGSPAIAAETEAIELLLQSKRINPKGGGGGGSTPGGGGDGKTLDSALALFGGGVNDKEVREDRGVSQATGDAGPSLPEEFRAGLDEYFNRLERGAGGQ